MSLNTSPQTDPRFGTPRRVERDTRGPVLLKVAALLGFSLHPWQRHVSDVALEVHASGVPFYRTVGVSIARQNGKTLLILARVVLELLGRERTVAYTAQDRITARRKWEEMCRGLMAIPTFAARVVHFHTNNGQEELLTDTGSRFVIVTPNDKAGRALTVDLAIVDEAFAHRSMAVVGALGGTMAARTHAQLWVVSNAGTNDSKLFRHYTETGRAQVDNPAAAMAWFEWCAADDADVFDRGAWVDANPSLDLPHGVVSAHLSDMALTIDGDQFRREYLNLWVDIDALVGIDEATWAACRSDALVPGDRVALGLDMTPERDRAALVAAGDVDGRTPLEVIEHTSDLSKIEARTAEVARRHRADVVIDRGSPACAFIPALERAKATVRLVNAPDFAKACGEFHDACRLRRVAHRGDYRLADAVLAATKRTQGDAWVWRRRGPSDITPLCAATLARWGIVSTKARAVPRIY